MRILIINWRDAKHPRAGGADFRLQNVYAPLVEKGHEVILYSCAFKNCSKNAIINGIRVYRIGNDWTFAFQCMLNIRKWVKQHKPDIVVEDLNKLPFYTPLFYKGPLVVQMHHLWRRSIFRETIWPIALIVWITELSIKWAYKDCYFSVVSPSTKDELMNLGIKENLLEVIYNGTDLESYFPAKNNRKLIMLWVGRIQRYKGPIQACQILELLQDSFRGLELIIVGDGPYKAKVESYAVSRGLNVNFTGFISKNEKINWYQKAAVHIQTSLKEGWGLSVIEANACGCPVVANNTTGLCDSVIDGKTGLLYRFDDVSDAAEKVKAVLNNKSKCDELINNGLTHAENYSWSKNSKEMSALLRRIIEERKDA